MPHASSSSTWPRPSDVLRRGVDRLAMKADEKAPTGMPDDAEEAPPLGVPEDADDDGVEELPGIPSEREPPSAG